MLGLADVALLYFGISYVWAGNNIESGFDCSGLVSEVSRSIGLLDKRDLRAKDLYKHFKPISKMFYPKELSFILW